MPSKIIKQKVVKYKGKEVLISCSQLPIGGFETGAFYVKTMNEIDIKECTYLEDALYYFDNFIKKYTDKPKKDIVKVPERYIKFADAYYKVYNETKEYFSNNPIMNDGGASNFDCAYVIIGKRLQKGLVKAALEKYNMKSKVDVVNDLIYVAVPYTNYQGFGNTEQARFMARRFQELGFIADIDYRID